MAAAVAEFAGIVSPAVGLAGGLVGVGVGVRVGVAATVGLDAGGVVGTPVGVGVAVAVATAVWGRAVAVAEIAAAVCVGVGVALPPPPSLFCRERANAATMPSPSDTSTMPTATRIAVPLTPCEAATGAGVRRMRAVVCRVCNCGGRPGGAAIGATGWFCVAGTRPSAFPNAAAVGYRSAGFRESARESTASSSGDALRANARSGGGGAPRRCPIAAPAVDPENGVRPATSSNTVSANE